MKGIIFDIDGTLLDTREFIFQAFEHVFRQHELTHLTRKDFVREILGKPLEECYATLAPDKDKDALSRMHRAFQAENFRLIELFPNTKMTLVQLKKNGIQMAIVSTRKQTGLASLEHTGILDFFDTIITGDDVTQFKPHPEGVVKALEQLQVKPTDAAMVGDAGVDIEAGKRAGTATVAAAYGFTPKESLPAFQPDYIIEDIADILEIV